MAARIVNAGARMDYTPAGAVSAGEIVVSSGTVLGLAPTAIASGLLGALDVDGVWRVPCGSAVAIGLGQDVFFHTTSAQATLLSASPRVYLGRCEKAKNVADEFVSVRRIPTKAQ